jgi:hypothetical protein
MVTVLYFVHCSFRFYWVDSACYFPSSHEFFIFSLEFYSFLTSPVCDCFASSFMWNISLCIFCNAGLVDKDHFSLSLSFKVFISSLRLKDSFSGYRILVWKLLCLRTWIILFHAFLAFKVCTERSEVFLMYLPFYVSWCFSLYAFSILSVFSGFVILIMIWLGLFFSGHVYLGFKCFLYVIVYVVT